MSERNVGASVHTRIRTLSKETGVDVPALMRRYAQERLVYRMSVSPEADNFCLKGGLLLAAYNSGDLLRPTEDVDFNGFDGEGDVARLERALRAVLAVEVPDDGVVFRPETIRIAKDRTGIIPGGKVVLTAMIHTTRVDVRVDVGFGNAVTPEPRTVEMPTLLPNIAPRPVVPAYPLETVVAEKFHAMVQFGFDNTRLKDYFDTWMLSRMHSFDGDVMADAIRRTFACQRRPIPDDIPDGLTDEFAREASDRWIGFVRKIGGRDAVPLAEVVERLREFILPVASAANGGTSPGEWSPDDGWSLPAPAAAP